MKLIRRFVVKALQHNVHCRAEHIPGSHNILADYFYVTRLNPGPLFTFSDGSQVLKTFFSSNLRVILYFVDVILHSTKATVFVLALRPRQPNRDFRNRKFSAGSLGLSEIHPYTNATELNASMPYPVEIWSANESERLELWALSLPRRLYSENQQGECLIWKI
ncbi:hypothetical protein MAR_007068 [Mya arenaria]|uniref:Uncharacterized protein n=1 Tax=Mya arenaria TaxID=6604 RepID=A0ABY7DAB8_MYAAR|nr:hypothetical protein MAR_007068 [Mya arenaria]